MKSRSSSQPPQPQFLRTKTVSSIESSKSNNVSHKAPKKKGGIAGGRTPLADLSNSLKNTPSLNPSHTSKKSSFSFIQREASNKKTTDSKPSSQRTSALTVVPEESFDPAEEGFLHNHDECIKSQTRSMAMDTDQFLQTLLAPPVSIQVKADSPPRHLELSEMIEPEFGDISVPAVSKLDSPPPCRSPVSPPRRSSVSLYPDPNFKLVDSPECNSPVSSSWSSPLSIYDNIRSLLMDSPEFLNRSVPSKPQRYLSQVRLILDEPESDLQQ